MTSRADGNDDGNVSNRHRSRGADLANAVANSEWRARTCLELPAVPERASGRYGQRRPDLDEPDLATD
jgi:hypothetical protein